MSYDYLMARPRIHEDGVTLSIRLPRRVKDSLLAEARRRSVTVNALVLDKLTIRVAEPSPIRATEPVVSRETPVTGDKNCPHKYRVQRGSSSVCASCGDER